jgi:hypothetical protein
MSDPFASNAPGLTSPGIGAFAITPNNSTDLAQAIRAVTIGGDAGVIVYDWQGTTYTTGALPVGTYAMRATRIRATGTTATGLTGWV